MENQEKQPGNCEDCAIWHPDPSVINRNLNGDSYGKCKATFTDQKGNPQVWDSASLGSSECFAVDDRENKLFTPKS